MVKWHSIAILLMFSDTNLFELHVLDEIKVKLKKEPFLYPGAK